MTQANAPHGAGAADGGRLYFAPLCQRIERPTSEAGDRAGVTGERHTNIGGQCAAVRCHDGATEGLFAQSRISFHVHEDFANSL